MQIEALGHLKKQLQEKHTEVNNSNEKVNTAKETIEELKEQLKSATTELTGTNIQVCCNVFLNMIDLATTQNIKYKI